MTTLRMHRFHLPHVHISMCVLRYVAALIGGMLVLALVENASAQDSIAAARDLYASARYDEALAVLNDLKGHRVGEPAEVRSIEQYRSFCLLALGRNTEADQAISAVITSDPFYQPGYTDASPRVRAAFRDVRKRLLPGIASQLYISAKAAFDRKDHQAASDQFKQVIVLLDDPDMQGRLADLRMLASGFYELSIAAATPPPPPAPKTDMPRPPSQPEAGAEPTQPRVYGNSDTEVTPPVTIRQDLPLVPPVIASQFRTRGVLEVVINEEGSVESAAVRSPVNPMYDSMMLAATQKWRYEPATLNGAPVKYRKAIQVTIAK